MTGLRRFHNARDKSEPEIFAALRDLGCLVEATHKPSDAVIQYRGVVYLIECKTPINKSGKVKFTKTQDKFKAKGWHVFTLTSADDAIQFIQSITQKRAA